MRKTDIKIANAMINILNDQRNNRISDNEIIQAAGVSRSTFYIHFRNQEEVLKFIFNIIDKNIFKEFEHINYFPARELNKSILIDHLSENVLPTIYEYRSLIKIMYSSNVSNIWNKFLQDKYTQELLRFLKAENTMHLKLFVKYILSIIELWITNPTVETPETFKNHFKDLCTSSIIDIK